MAKKTQVEIDQEEQNKKERELQESNEAQREEALRQERLNSLDIELPKNDSYAEKVANAYDKFLKEKNTSGATADWEGKHNITDKSKLPNAAKVGLGIAAAAAILVIFSLFIMGMPFALLALPIVIGGLYLGNKAIQNYISPANTSVWGKEQRELANYANITTITTHLRNSNLNCKTKDFHEIKFYLNSADDIAKKISNNYMSAGEGGELKSKLLEASKHIARCEALIARNQNLNNEMERLKNDIDALPYHVRRDVYEKYHELEERLDKGATNVAYDVAMSDMRKIRDMLTVVQASLPSSVQPVPTKSAPKSVSPSAPSMTDILANRTPREEAPSVSGITMSKAPKTS